MTKNIIDYANKYLKLEKFIFSSTAMVYKNGIKNLMKWTVSNHQITMH